MGEGKLYIGFSGGEDSSLVALLAKEALGADRITLVTIDWGDYTYSISRKIVRDFSKKHGLPHIFVKDTKKRQIGVWRHGPSCNSCTRYAKIPILKEVAGDNLAATGANAFDTWGKTGLRVHNNVYAPLSGVTKDEIRAMLRYLKVEIERIGESADREGCKLKNLLKMLINPEYHGKAVSESNELLLNILENHGLKLKRASVKIVGPLSRNIAILVLDPMPPDRIVKELVSEVGSLDTVEEVWLESEISGVTVIASPPIYRNPEARGNVSKVIGLRGRYRWVESKNNRLRTFQVVEVR